MPDGRRLLAIHVAPGLDDGAGLTDNELSAQVAAADAELVCVGHSQWPFDRRVDGIRVINTGSVSNPLAMDLRASYATIDSSPSRLAVEHYRVAYNVQAVIEAIQRSRHPAGDFIISHFRGERFPAWAKP
ncbi:MAG TPA: hypothetical protein VGL99_16820 [Chloroflexota bacterium]